MEGILRLCVFSCTSLGLDEGNPQPFIQRFIFQSLFGHRFHFIKPAHLFVVVCKLKGKIATKKQYIGNTKKDIGAYCYELFEADDIKDPRIEELCEQIKAYSEEIEALEAEMKKIGVGEIATVSGRYYAMDRDNRWDRVELAYKALTEGEGVKGTDAAAAVQASYDADKTDEFVLPTVIEKAGKPVATISDKDSVVFFNFRPDRAREITHAFCDDNFDGFAREKKLDLVYVCFTDYDETITNKLVAFKKESITNTFGEFLAANGKKQVRIAETEKYAHVTFFFNGGVEEPNEGEDRILVPSPKEVATYDLKPEMSAYGVCDKLTEAIKSGKYDVIIINFANPDMVGHTGVQEAAIKAVETVDECVGKAVGALKEVDGQMFICADHGNAEQLIDYETGAPWTAHTTNPVPFILVNADPKYTLRENGCLADIVPTLIQLMGMEQPAEMTGKSLLVEK